MEHVCPNCGTARAERDFCFCAPVPSPHDPRPDVPYTPPWHWHCFGFIAWLVTVSAAVHPSASTAYFIGECMGALIIPVLLRVGYVVVFARGPYMGNRAVLSPWVWAIALVMNVMMAAGNHPH